MILTICALIVGNPLYKGGGGGVEFSKFLKKRGLIFFHKKGEVGKIGRGITYFHINYFHILFIYTISISVICVSPKEPSVTTSNQ